MPLPHVRARLMLQGRHAAQIQFHHGEGDVPELQDDALRRLLPGFARLDSQLAHEDLLEIDAGEQDRSWALARQRETRLLEPAALGACQGQLRRRSVEVLGELQAGDGRLVVNAFHLTLDLEPAPARVLPTLSDGTWSREQLLQAMTTLASGEPTERAGGWPTTADDVEAALAKLGDGGLLVE